MTQKTWRVLALTAAAAVLLGGTAHAKLNQERGKIASTNWNQMEMDINTKGRTATWKVVRDCEVKFLDQKEKFPNPSLKDLKPPMYIAYMFEENTNVIQSIEVIELGYDASVGGPGAQQNGVVSNFDMDKGHIEVMLDPGGRKTFEVDPKGQLAGIQKGDSVNLLIENRGGREVVTKITKSGDGAGTRGRVRRP